MTRAGVAVAGVVKRPDGKVILADKPGIRENILVGISTGVGHGEVTPVIVWIGDIYRDVVHIACIIGDVCTDGCTKTKPDRIRRSGNIGYLGWVLVIVIWVHVNPIGRAWCCIVIIIISDFNNFIDSPRGIIQLKEKCIVTRRFIFGNGKCDGFLSTSGIDSEVHK